MTNQDVLYRSGIKSQLLKSNPCQLFSRLSILLDTQSQQQTLSGNGNPLDFLRLIYISIICLLQ